MNPQTGGDSFDILDLTPELPAQHPRGLPEGAPQGWRHFWGWSGRSAPIAMLLLAGIGLGPLGINLLSPAMPLLDPVVPVALAALGVLVGLGLGNRRTDERRLVGAAGLHALVTMLVVSGGIAVVALGVVPEDSRLFWTVVLISGICAATSLTLPSGDPLEPRTPVARLVELGVLVPIVAGGLALAWLRAGSPVGAITLVAQASGVILMLAAAAWLLLTAASSETEERVFAVSALLLVGGVADALLLSAPFVGLIAGVFWRYAGRHPREAIRRDVLFVQHPLLVLVLLLAGARAEPSAAALALGAGYFVLRIAASLAGGMLARRVAGTKVPADLGRHLLPPGVFGVAFALNAVSVIGADAAMAHAAVVAGTIGSELVAVVLRPRRVAE
jgi:hypothetical protein